MKRFMWLFRFAVFNFLAAFVTTCNFYLVSTGSGASFDDVLKTRKFAVLLNVCVLALIFTLLDWMYHKWMVDKPIERILAATGRIKDGDYDVRIKPLPFPNDLDPVIADFNLMAEELSEVESLRDDFVASVSHELKTPLAVISNCAKLLENTDLTADMRAEYTGTIQQTCRDFSELITNILRLDKLEHREIYPRADEYDLGEQLRRCLLVFEGIWEDKGIDLACDIDDDVMVTSDADLLGVVWNNLFSNAFKFTETGGSVCVTMTAGEETAVVTVADTGCGISSETGRHIFDKFYQGDTSHRTQGNGLGLALVKRIVDIVGADISVTSKLGIGSSFTVRVPVIRGLTGDDA